MASRVLLPRPAGGLNPLRRSAPPTPSQLQALARGLAASSRVQAKEQPSSSSPNEVFKGKKLQDGCARVPGRLSASCFERVLTAPARTGLGRSR